MNQANNRNEYQARRHERLTPEGVAAARMRMASVDTSLGLIYPVVMRLQESKPAVPQADTTRAETYQSVDGGRQYQFAPLFGASAVQPDFVAREQRMRVSDGRINLDDPDDDYQQPGYLTENEPVNSAVLEAERIVAEAYLNGPSYSGSQENEYAA